MRFREERRRYLDNGYIRFACHLLVQALGLGAVLAALLYGSWLPIILYCVVLTLFEAFWWYDTFHGWAIKK